MCVTLEQRVSFIDTFNIQQLSQNQHDIQLDIVDYTPDIICMDQE